jgi:hypothetical protein
MSDLNIKIILNMNNLFCWFIRLQRKFWVLYEETIRFNDKNEKDGKSKNGEQLFWRKINSSKREWILL